MMEGHHHHHHHQYSGLHSIDTGGSGSGGGGVGVGSGGDRFPQWSIQETRDFLMIRAELDPTFMETKRNKLLWEVIATRMREKGYNRSAEQCKCKWKNLVTRYKGCETMEAEGMRQQFPFYNELQAIFAARMQRMLWMEAEGGGGGSKKKATALSSDEEDENMGEEMSEGEKASNNRKKRKTKGITITTTGGGGGIGTNSSNSNREEFINNVREMLEEFMKQQMAMEMQWIQANEAREEERRKREIEWRQKLEALENERLIMERRWREREEQRKIREEVRAERRDALITSLLNKLRRDEDL